jgi:hypothetical protein
LTASYNATPTTNTCQYTCDTNSVWNWSSCNLAFFAWTSKWWSHIKTWWDLQPNWVIYIWSSTTCALYKFNKTWVFSFWWTASCWATRWSTTNSYYSNDCWTTWNTLSTSWCTYCNDIINNNTTNNWSWYLSINDGWHWWYGCGNSSWQTISAWQLCNPMWWWNHVAGYNWVMWR